uniref:Hypoxanthine phosphoribosyltransferase n=2 Tax=Opuntia streptacantha TaxID=393608 RepID=A0A7C8ZSB0_OPUST
MEGDIERVLWNEDQISKRVSELAAQLTLDFTGAPPPVFVGVATGAAVFLADLVRRLSIPVFIDFVRVGSYGFGTQSNGAPTITSDLKLDVSGKHVVLVFFSLSLSLSHTHTRTKVKKSYFVEKAEITKTGSLI